MRPELRETVATPSFKDSHGGNPTHSSPPLALRDVASDPQRDPPHDILGVRRAARFNADEQAAAATLAHVVQALREEVPLLVGEAVGSIDTGRRFLNATPSRVMSSA
jgi:hypothetical protein